LGGGKKGTGSAKVMTVAFGKKKRIARREQPVFLKNRGKPNRDPNEREKYSPPRGATQPEGGRKKGFVIGPRPPEGGRSLRRRGRRGKRGIFMKERKKWGTSTRRGGNFRTQTKKSWGTNSPSGGKRKEPARRLEERVRRKKWVNPPEKEPP